MSTVEDEFAELRGLIPRILQALHAKQLWLSVTSAADISCELFTDQPKPYIGILRPANNAPAAVNNGGTDSLFPVVVKFESKVPLVHGDYDKFLPIDARVVELHQLLSDHGLATTLLAHSLQNSETNEAVASQLPNFTVETLGVCLFNLAECEAAGDTYWDTANSAAGGGGDMARLAARLHRKVDPQWFAQLRREICEVCPLMKEQADDSPLWVMMRADKLGEAKKAAAEKKQPTTFLHQTRAHAPTDEDIKRLVALLPKPCGEHASRVVTCHGDLWLANVVKDTRSGQAALIDLEGVCVSYAATDFAQFGNERGVAQVYLEEWMLMESGGTDEKVSVKKPTEDEIDKFWFEVLVASHVQCSILRPTCWHGELSATSMRDELAHAERFLAYVEKLRADWDLALRIVRKAAEAAEKPGGDMDQWCSEETMDSVLGSESAVTLQEMDWTERAEEGHHHREHFNGDQ